MRDPVGIDFRQIGQAAGQFPPEAVHFVFEGLQHTVRMIHGEAVASASVGVPDEHSRHVTGQQLCLGLRDFAIRRYGMLARTVLSRWNVRRTEDFGRIVFALVEGQAMRKNDGDTFSDFENVFDFDEAFDVIRVG